MYEYATTPEARRAAQFAGYERAMMLRAMFSWLFSGPFALRPASAKPFGCEA